MTKSIRALERGLAVLEVLGQRKATSLAAISRATDLSKATLLRLLKTLIDQGWAYRRVNDGGYCLARAPGGRDQAALGRTRFASTGAPFLQQLTATTGLPADLTMVVEDGVLEVVESTRAREIGGVDPLVVGFRPSLVFSAPGRAILAASDGALRELHLAHLRRGDSPAERFFVTSGSLAKELQHSQKVGFARREKSYWPNVSDYGEEPMDIAVSLGSEGAPVGALSIVWPTAQQAPEQVVAAHLAPLSETAKAMTAALTRPWDRKR